MQLLYSRSDRRFVQTTRASSGLSVADFVLLRGFDFDMQSPPVLLSERSTSPSFSAFQVAKQVGISHGSATSTVGMLPLPDAMHWPERPMTLKRVQCAFTLAHEMMPSLSSGRSARASTEAAMSAAPSIDVKAELPTVLTLLGLQWRPNWADTLRRSGVAALREVLLEARKRWLKLYFGAEDFSFSGSAQLLTAQYSKEAYASHDLVEHAQLDVRQQLSPLLSTDDDDTRTGQPMDELQLPELCHIVCMLLQFEAFAVYTAQWSVACSTSTASLLASPGPGSFRRMSVAANRRASKIFAKHAKPVHSSSDTDLKRASSTPVHGTVGASGNGSTAAVQAVHGSPPAAEADGGSAAEDAATEEGSTSNNQALSSGGALLSIPDEAQTGASSPGRGGLFDEGSSLSSGPSVRQSCRLPHGLVFLGGACGPTSWRRDLAIPELGAAKIPFFNPQVEEWSPELVDVEAAKKAEAGTLLFVISERTRSIASMIEAAEHITAGERHVVLVIRMVPEAAIGREDVSTVAASTQDSSSPVRQPRRPAAATDLTGLTASEQKDLNRGRTYLADIAERHGVRVFDRVDTAVQHLVQEYSFTWSPLDDACVESPRRRRGATRDSSMDSDAFAVQVASGESPMGSPRNMKAATSASAPAAPPAVPGSRLAAKLPPAAPPAVLEASIAAAPAHD